VNDLLPFYKKFDKPRDQASLVKNYAEYNQITLEEALKKAIMTRLQASSASFAIRTPRFTHNTHIPSALYHLVSL
jgi:hypothetical protein